MEEILAALKTTIVWGVGGGAVVLAALLAKVIAPFLYERSQKSGRIDLVPLMFLVLVPGVALTFLVFQQRGLDFVTLGIIALCTLAGALIIWVQSKKKTYNRARNVCAVASWMAIYLATLAALLAGHLMNFDSKMLVVTALIASVIPAILYQVIGRDPN